MKNRLLILSASIGAGHVKAAEALAKAYNEQFGGEAVHLDFFRYASPTISRWAEQAYYIMTKHTPGVYKLLYDIEDRPNSPTKKMEVHLGTKRYKDLIKEYRPDAIISTHFLPAAVVSHMYQRFPIPNGVLLTDYISHPMWLYPNNQRFFVAHAGMAEELKRFGIEEDRIRVTGIPVRPCFAQKFDRRQLRAKLKLDPELVTILLMSGGNAIGPLVEVLSALSRIDKPYQIVVITGRNRKVFRELSRVRRAVGLRGRILGYVENVHEWMAISDLLISKAGGLTVTEALNSGLPMLIIRPTPGQEVGNTEFLQQAGACLPVKNVKELIGALDGLLNNPEQLRMMKESTLRLARPNATMDILTEMEALLEASRQQAGLI